MWACHLMQEHSEVAALLVVGVHYASHFFIPWKFSVSIHLFLLDHWCLPMYTIQIIVGMKVSHRMGYFGYNRSMLQLPILVIQCPKGP